METRSECNSRTAQAATALARPTRGALSRFEVDVQEIVDLRPIDFATQRRLAIGPEAMERCEACGAAMAVVHVLTTGHRLGSSCATVVPLLRCTANVDRVLDTLGLKAGTAAFFAALFTDQPACSFCRAIHVAGICCCTGFDAGDCPTCRTAAPSPCCGGVDAHTPTCPEVAAAREYGDRVAMKRRIMKRRYMR